MIIGIVAVDRNLAIGKDGGLPWHYSTDLKFFKAMTVGNTVVMGRRTYLSLKSPLKHRDNIVLSSTLVEPPEGFIVMKDAAAVIARSEAKDNHLFVIGGAKVYETFRESIERWIVTEVPLSVAGADTFMRPDFLEEFELSEVRQLDEGLRVKFYDRKSQSRVR